MLTAIRGSLVSAVLAGSWRPGHHGPLSISSAQFDDVTPLLYGSGAAALSWWRMRETALSDSPSGDLLHQAYCLQVLRARVHENQTKKIAQMLRTAGIESIIIKGWAVARHYPQIGLRPSGDVDLVIRPRELRAAQDVVASEAARECWVDLHPRIFELSDRSLEDLWARSQLVSCGTEQVRVLAPEDHLALLAVHLLKHGAWRPLWLCDLGLLLEVSPDSFDWELCLGQSKQRANWILSALGLAQALLDARIKNEAVAEKAKEIPAWLLRSVLKQWERPFAIDQPPMNHRAPMRSYLRSPAGVLRDLANRWPNPVLATVSVNGQFNSIPRLPYQLGNLAARTMRFLMRLPKASS